jgi:transcriptional regulator with PAS, ATPase and Fis domain
MGNPEELLRKLEKAGKFDKLPILREIIEQQNRNKDKKVLQTYETALEIFKDYLDFDPQPTQAVCNNLTRIFNSIIKAIRYFGGPAWFSRIYNEFCLYEHYFNGDDPLADIFADLSYLFWLQKDLKKSLRYGLQSLEILQKSGNQDILPGRYTNVGFIYEEMRDFATAEKYYEEGMNFGLLTNSDSMVSLAYCGNGRLQLKMSNFKAAINYFLEALKYIPDEESENYIAVCSNLGTAYGRLKDYEESLRYFTRFINNKTKSRFPEMYYSLLLNAANCYEFLGDYDQSETYLKEIIEYAEQEKNPELMAGALINLGRLENNKEHWEAAQEYLQESKKYSKMTGNRLQNALSDSSLGVAYTGAGNFDKALISLNSCLKTVKELNMKLEIKKCYDKLALVYEKLGDFRQALENYKLFHHYESKIKDEQFDLDLKNLRKTYQKKAQIKERTNFFPSYSFISRELANLVKTPLIGTSKSLQEVVNKAMIAAENDSAAVLLTGESGTGKEIIARIIHFAGYRKKSPFITVNSVAFAGSLIESAFFGSEKGAFTGATDLKTGYFEAVQNGTLFLDEIGDMPLEMQAKLLRVLEEQIIHRIGSTKDIILNFRLISATNKNLYRMSEENSFRFDLLNRINTLEIFIPPLRERKEDIPLLVDYFVSLFTRQSDISKPILTKSTLELLIDYEYPGNVRELKNIIQRTILLNNKAVLEPADIIFPSNETATSESKHIAFPSLNLAETERILINSAMQKAGNVQVQAAKLLGISPYALNRKLKKMR